MRDEKKDHGAGLAAVGNDTPVVTPERQANPGIALKTGHAKGPWEVHETNDYYYIRPKGTGWLVAIVRKDEFNAQHLSDQKADAHLIAAAPELLEALKAMVASYDGVRTMVTSDVILEKLARADAALRKAEGNV